MSTLCLWGFILIFALNSYIERGGIVKVPNLIVYFWMQLRSMMEQFSYESDSVSCFPFFNLGDSGKAPLVKSVNVPR